MPILRRAPNERELQKLISIFLKAETDIINELGRLRSAGLVGLRGETNTNTEATEV